MKDIHILRKIVNYIKTITILKYKYIMIISLFTNILNLVWISTNKLHVTVEWLQQDYRCMDEAIYTNGTPASLSC